MADRHAGFRAVGDSGPSGSGLSPGSRVPGQQSDPTGQHSGGSRGGVPTGQHSGESIAAIVLAGGQATRLGGADKPGVSIGGRTLVSWVVDATAQAGASRIVIVGPPRPGMAAPGAAIEVTRERPAGGGPVPALRAGLRLVTEPWLLLLAADMPFLRARHLRALLFAARPVGHAVLADDHGRPQWLCGCWRAADLRAAMASYQGSSLRGVLEPLRPAMVTIELTPPDPPPWLDCDTPADVATAQAWSARPTAVSEPRPLPS